MACFHGREDKQCFWCGVIRAQALGLQEPPMAKRAWVGVIWDRLVRWAKFWQDPTPTVAEILRQEAHRVALQDELITPAESDNILQNQQAMDRVE